MNGVLIVKLGAIGDLVMATPALHDIRARHPDARIVLLTGAWSAPVVTGNPAIDEVLIVDERIFWKPVPGALVRLLAALRRRRFAVAYLMHWSPLFGLFALAAGIPERVGFRRGERAWFLTRSVPFTEGDRAGSHAIAQYRALATGKLAADLPRPVWVLAADEQAWAHAWCRDRGIPPDAPLVAVAPGGGDNPRSSMPLRRWPVHGFREVIRRLLADDPALWVVLLGGMRDRALAQALAEDLDPVRVTTAAGALSLRESAAVLARCRCLLCNDSGLMHIAGALNVPTVAIFGPTAPWDKLPPGPLHRALYAGSPCSPCYRFGRFPECTDPVCMASISPDAAVRAVQEVLAARR